MLIHIESFNMQEALNWPIEKGTFLQKLAEEAEKTAPASFAGLEYETSANVKGRMIYVCLKERK
jgi:hypothetical protein